MHIDDGALARTALHIVDEGHLVDDGLGIGHAYDGRDTAGGGGIARRLQRLAVFLAGIAGEHLHVDEAGCEHVALAVDDSGAIRCIPPQMSAEIGDRTIAHHQAAGLVAPRGGVDQTRVQERGCSRLGLGGTGRAC